MKKRALRIAIEILVAIMLVTLVSIVAVGAGRVSDDPADSYEYIEAEYEDYDINLWFDYSFRKTFMDDTVSTGKDTFSIYMAKNEIESAQFVLLSDCDKPGMTATLSPFTDGQGHTVDADIYYEMYITATNLDTTAVLYSDENTTFIREGKIPDPIAPLSNIGTFQLNENESQAFLIRAKTDMDTAAGWYSATLDIKNADNEVVKTAEVYLKVWDFAIPEKTALDTGIIMYNHDMQKYGGTYKIFYDYLLENRINAMDVPGGRPSINNEYFTNDRVTTIRVSSTGLGSASAGYLEEFSPDYTAMYNEFSDSPIWDDIKDKFLFYSGDEPLSAEWGWAAGANVPTLDSVHYAAASTVNAWPGARTTVAFHENHMYPAWKFTGPISDYEDYELTDAIGAMLDKGYLTVQCPQLYAFTPTYELDAYGYSLFGDDEHIRNLSYELSWSLRAPNQGMSGYYFYRDHMIWEHLLGDAYDRYISDNLVKGKDELWTYSAGWNKSYSYCDHLIENTGLQTKLLFWQLYQNDITGYLYYSANGWDDYGTGYDSTVTGAKTNSQWRVNRYDYPASGRSANRPAHSIYGNGVLFYGRDQGKIRGTDVVGSLRVEIMRDGIEEYTMMDMLEKLKGSVEAKSYVNSVCKNVVNYISMPAYDRSAWNFISDDYAVVETVRRAMGESIEAATLAGVCEHTWDAGEVTKPATCLAVGEKTHTCTKCGATDIELLPALHTEGSCFVKISGSPATCSTSSSEIFRCTICGYRKASDTPSHHADVKSWNYVEVTPTSHKAVCKYCDLDIGSAEQHVFLREKVLPTCQANGYNNLVCKCGATSQEVILPKLEHNYVDGVCTMCGEEESAVNVTYGDLNGDGKVTAVDLNVLAKAIVGTIELTEAQETAGDVSGDGKLTAADTNFISKYISGILPLFPVET